MEISQQKKARSRDFALLLYRMTSRVFIVYSTIGSTVHSAFEQIEALHMHNHDDKYPARPGFEPVTSRLQVPVDTNEPSGPVSQRLQIFIKNFQGLSDIRTIIELNNGRVSAIFNSIKLKKIRVHPPLKPQILFHSNGLAI